jgi:hypothetical protein
VDFWSSDANMFRKVHYWVVKMTSGLLLRISLPWLSASQAEFPYFAGLGSSFCVLSIPAAQPFSLEGRFTLAAVCFPVTRCSIYWLEQVVLQLAASSIRLRFLPL